MTDRPGLTRWRAVWYAVSQFWHDYRQFWKGDLYHTRPGYFYGRAPWFVRVVEVLYVAPLYAAYQAWAHFVLDPWELSVRPFDWLWRAWNPVMGWCEDRTVWYAWCPPLSDDPTEVGFHLRADLVARNKAERMRVFVSQVP